MRVQLRLWLRWRLRQLRLRLVRRLHLSRHLRLRLPPRGPRWRWRAHSDACEHPSRLRDSAPLALLVAAAIAAAQLDAADAGRRATEQPALRPWPCPAAAARAAQPDPAALARALATASAASGAAVAAAAAIDNPALSGALLRRAAARVELECPPAVRARRGFAAKRTSGHAAHGGEYGTRHLLSGPLGVRTAFVFHVEPLCGRDRRAARLLLRRLGCARARRGGAGA